MQKMRPKDTMVLKGLVPREGTTVRDQIKNSNLTKAEMKENE